MPSLIETRHKQMLPMLSVAESDGLRRFGETRAYRAGDRLMMAGDVSLGIFVILDGQVTITQHSRLEHAEAIVTHGPGSVMGELTGLSGRPAFVDATKPVKALVISSRRLRDVLVAEAARGTHHPRAHPPAHEPARERRQRICDRRAGVTPRAGRAAGATPAARAPR